MPEITIQQAFELAVQHQQGGRLQEAESIYRQILAVEPRHADSLHYLGLIAHQVGRNDVAIELIRQALALQPDFPDAHDNLGTALREIGRCDEAIAAHRRALALRPDDPETLNNLGNALDENGQLDEAIASYHQAIALRPDFALAHRNLANVLKGRGRSEEAIAAYRRIIMLKPDDAEAHVNLGMTLHETNCLDEAIAAYRKAIALKTDYPEAYNNLGVGLCIKGCLDEAITAYRHAIALRPDYPEAHNNIANALNETGCLDEAIAAYRRAIALKPDYPEAHNNLGNALRGKGQIEEAIACYRQAIALKADYPAAYNNLGAGLCMNGLLDEAIAAFRQAIALKPDYHDAHSNLLFTLLHHPEWDAEVIAEEHRNWDSVLAEPLRQFIRPHANDRDPTRRLRIGYVSPDFRIHSVAYFLEGLLTEHDRAQVEVFCYSDVMNPDAVTARMKQQAGHWRNIVGMKEPELADLVREDRIDILVDLAGHTAKNRLLAFAHKPAPVQVTWLGYPDTTGLATMDYRMTDAHADPPGSTEALHTEQLVRLPRSAWCYRPPENGPTPASLPALGEGRVTFGSFHKCAKLNQPLLELWARILLAVPDSRLLLKNGALVESSTQQQIRSVFEQAGIAPQRLQMVSHAPDFLGHLGTYGKVDIALDTFPYHGTTTTCEALWMGVPVLTLAGETHVSRVGVSLLSNLGHPEWIAASPEEYVKLAVEMAGDIPHLAELRSSLREKMQASPLMDAAGFARDIEAAYRKMWRTWCEQHGSQPCPK